MISIGIDPGKTGAIAILNGTRQVVFDCPIFGTRSKPGDYNPAEMASLLKLYGGDDGCYVTIEAQQAMPKQGVSSTFKTGMGYGLWLGIIATMGLPYQIVRASVWKSAMLRGLDKTDKNVSRIAATRLFPALAPELARVADHGRAEALLIARFGAHSQGWHNDTSQ